MSWANLGPTPMFAPSNTSRPIFLVRAPALASVLALSLLSSGCGAGVQALAGWTKRDVTTRSDKKTVNVTSIPAGAQVMRRDPDGRTSDLGLAPLQHVSEVQVRETKDVDQNTWLWVGAIAELVTGVAVVAATLPTDQTSSPDPSVATDQASTGETVGGAFALAGIVDLVLALVHSDETVVERAVVSGGGDFVYTGRLPGLPDAQQTISLPNDTLVSLVLDPEAAKRAAVAKKPTTPSTSTPATSTPASSGTVTVATAKPAVLSDTARGWIIAVMDVVDANADDPKRSLARGLVRDLGDQIRVFVAEQGLRTIDRGSQERALKERIAAMKSESYKSCYADSCQVELGKALAASHILRTHITRFGHKCVLNGELIDLKTEVTSAASSAQGNCEAEGFLTMGEQVAKSLVAGR